MTTPIRYAAQAKPSRPIFPYVAAAAVLAVAFLAGRASVTAPTTSEPPDAPSSLATTADETWLRARVMSLEAENKGLKAKVQTAGDSGPEKAQTAASTRPELGYDASSSALEAEAAAQIENLEGLVAGLRRENASLMKGLRAAVDELNARQRRAPRRVEPAKTAKKEKCCTDLVFVRQPEVVVGKIEVAVTGSVNNLNSETAAGYLDLELFANGDRIASQRVFLELPQTTVTTYDAVFSEATFPGYRYSVNATWHVE